MHLGIHIILKHWRAKEQERNFSQLVSGSLFPGAAKVTLIIMPRTCISSPHIHICVPIEFRTICSWEWGGSILGSSDMHGML